MKYFRLYITAILLGISTSTFAEYTAAQFFKDASTEYIATEEPISEQQKQAIIDAKFLRGNEVCQQIDESADEYFELWYVTQNTDRLLGLSQCQQSKAEIHLYKHLDGGYVVAVVSILGNHGTQQFRFFRIAENDNINSEMTFDELELYPPKENEFLSELQQFPEEKNMDTFFAIKDNGMIDAYPNTWMEERWENLDPVNEIWFEWSGRKFTKRIKRIFEH